MAAFDRCDEISGNSDVASLGRAPALAAQKRYGEAVSTVLKGRTVKTSNDFYRLSSFYAGNGDKEKALATLQKSFDLGYRDFPAINANPASCDCSRIVGNPYLGFEYDRSGSATCYTCLGVFAGRLFRVASHF